MINGAARWSPTGSTAFDGRFPFVSRQQKAAPPCRCWLSLCAKTAGGSKRFLTTELNGVLHKEGSQWVPDKVNSHGLVFNPGLSARRIRPAKPAYAPRSSFHRRQPGDQLSSYRPGLPRRLSRTQLLSDIERPKAALFRSDGLTGRLSAGRGRRINPALRRPGRPSMRARVCSVTTAVPGALFAGWSRVN